MDTDIILGLAEFIKKSPTAFHAVDEIRRRLLADGFRELSEREQWELSPGDSCFVIRNGSSVIAWKMGTGLKELRFQITASHSDSPTFRVKEQAEQEVKGKYLRLNTEGYGGMLMAPWFDRPLSVAGRVMVRSDGRYRMRLFSVDRDLVLIPNLAIHMNRKANEGYAYNMQVDMLPLFGGEGCKKGAFKELITRELGVEKDQVAGMDLYLYNRMEASVWGVNREFISAPRLDDLQCAYTSFRGFLKGGCEDTVSMFACFDNEEVGSVTKQGAGSPFLSDVLRRINLAFGGTEEEYYRSLAKSFLLSCDNAHAVHPNHPEKTDEDNCAYMNGGIVVKSHAGQKYTSDGVSIALFREICERAGVPTQPFANRSDMSGGSTLGNIAMTQVSVNSVDVGLAQLAMHSPFETAGVKDCEYMARAVETFYNTCIDAVGDREWIFTGNSSPS